MAKRNRETKLRERRMEKQAKKQARKLASADPVGEPSDDTAAGDDTMAGDDTTAGDDTAAEGVVRDAADA